MKFRTMIVPASLQAKARAICEAVDPVHSIGLFTTGLKSVDEVTHYISSGYISSNFEAPLPCKTYASSEENEWDLTDTKPGSPDEVYAMLQALATPPDVSLQDIEDLFDQSDVTEQEPFTAMARLGLSLYVSPEEI